MFAQVFNKNICNYKACNTGCSVCSNATASSCSACISGYNLVTTYCCATATPVL